MIRRLAPLVHGIRLGAGMAVFLLLPTIMIAQLDRSRPPAPAPPPVVQLGKYESFTLSNGMRVIVVENHKLPLVGIQVRFDIPPVVQGDRVGYVEMLGEMLTAGTGRRTKVMIDEEIDRLGAQLMATSDGVYASGLKRNLTPMLDILQDVVTNATFPDKELERVRTRFRSAVKQRKDDPDAIAEAVGRSVTFGRTHPYGEVMSEKSLDIVQREQLEAHYKRFFRPENAYLVFVGDVTLKEAKDLAKKHFNKWKVPVNYTVNEDGTETVEGLGVVRMLDKPKEPSGKRRVVMVDRPGAAQSVIRVSYPLDLQPKDLRSMNAQVMNTILGGGVFNARLMQNLREDKAYTYGAYSVLEVDRSNGSFTVSVSVRTEVTDSAVTEILKELDRMRSAPVTEEELELAKSFMAGSFARSLEDPRTVARFALNTYLNDLPKDHYATYLKRLEAVTTEDVASAARAFIHPDNAIIFVVGDKEQIQYKLPALAANPNAPILELDENGEIHREELRPVTTGISAENVIDNYLRSLGGRAAIEKLGNVYMRMSSSIGGMAVTVEQWHGTNGRFRSKTSAEGMGVLQEVVYDGSRAVGRSPQGEQELMGIDLLDVKANALAVPEMTINDHVERMNLSGITEIDGKEAYKVTMSTRAGTTVSDYYAVDGGLRLRRVDQKFVMGRPMTITTDYHDHKATKGVLFPRRIEQGGGPMGEMELVVEQVEVGQDLPADFFETGLTPISDEEEGQ